MNFVIKVIPGLENKIEYCISKNENKLTSLSFNFSYKIKYPLTSSIKEEF